LCLAVALWNGRDPFLKERAFGLTGPQGNRGEDVKEYYFYLDATPSHSWLRYLYKYPQAAYPYQRLIDENARRDRDSPPFNLLDAGVFDGGRYFDVEVIYSKAGPEEIHARITAHNRGSDTAELHLLPTLWFRNTWTWSDTAAKPGLSSMEAPPGAAWLVQADHPRLGRYHLYGRQPAELLFTENESNAERLWRQPNAAPYVKDSFHSLVVDGANDAVNPERRGTKFAAWHKFGIPGGQDVRIDLVLSAHPLATPFARSEVVFSTRQSEANVFFDELLPRLAPKITGSCARRSPA
jgi:hypothetical protein